jgi:hypothetical protein
MLRDSRAGGHAWGKGKITWLSYAPQFPRVRHAKHIKAPGTSYFIHEMLQASPACPVAGGSGAQAQQLFLKSIFNFHLGYEQPRYILIFCLEAIVACFKGIEVFNTVSFLLKQLIFSLVI